MSLNALRDEVCLEVLNAILTTPPGNDATFEGLTDCVVDDAHEWAIQRGWAVSIDVDEDDVEHFRPTDRGFRAVNAYRRRNGMREL